MELKEKKGLVESELMVRKEEERQLAENVHGRKGRIRRATFDDLKGIMEINDDVYYGFDYMPALFYIFMQSKLHVIYVYEEDNKPVFLVNFRFHPDSADLVSAMSGRVHPSYQNRGLGAAATSPGFAQLVREHPKVTRYVTDKLNLAVVSAKMEEKNVLYHWNVLIYKLANSLRLSHSIRQMAAGVNRPISLSYSSGIEWLEGSGQLLRFLSKYVVNLFPIGAGWMPLPANNSGLRQALSYSTVYISLDRASTVNPGCSTDSTSSPIDGQGLQQTRERWAESDVVGLSFSTVLPCKYGIRIDIFFFGDCEEIFLSHVYCQLLHCIEMTPDDVKLGLQLHFPLQISSRNVEERLREAIGERFHGFGATEAVQYIAEFPQAKL